MLRVSAGFLGISGSLAVAEETYRRQEYLVPSECRIMATIKARKQADGSTRYTAIVRIRSGKAIVHQESRDLRASLRGAVSWAKHREVAWKILPRSRASNRCTHVRRAHPLVHRHLRDRSRSGSGASRLTWSSWSAMRSANSTRSPDVRGADRSCALEAR